MGKKRILAVSGIILLVAIALYYLISSWYHHNQPITLFGNVDIRDVNIGFRVGGRLMELKVDEGDSVTKGELIARIDPDPYQREVNSAKAAVNQQKAALAYAETVYAREKKLYGTGASSIDKYENALSSHNSAQASLDRAIADLSQAILRLEDTYLYAPAEGDVLTRAVEPGTMLIAGAPIITVSLVNPVWVRAYISEPDLSSARQGVKVKVYSDSHPDTVYEGQIGFVSPTAEFTPKNVETTDLRTQLVYRLRIVVKDPHHELRQGMPVTVKFPRKGSDDVKNRQ